MPTGRIRLGDESVASLRRIHVVIRDNAIGAEVGIDLDNFGLRIAVALRTRNGR